MISSDDMNGNAFCDEPDEQVEQNSVVEINRSICFTSTGVQDFTSRVLKLSIRECYHIVDKFAACVSCANKQEIWKRYEDNIKTVFQMYLRNSTGDWIEDKCSLNLFVCNYGSSNLLVSYDANMQIAKANKVC